MLRAPVTVAILFVGTVATSRAEAVEAGTGTVVEVMRSGAESIEEFQVKTKYQVTGGYESYKPERDSKWVLAGKKYNLLTVTDPKSKAQLLIVWSGIEDDELPLEELLGAVYADVHAIQSKAIAAKNDPIRPGDRVKIARRAARTGWDIIFDIYREKKPIATFTFLQED